MPTATYTLFKILTDRPYGSSVHRTQELNSLLHTFHQLPLDEHTALFGTYTSSTMNNK